MKNKSMVWDYTGEHYWGTDNTGYYHVFLTEEDALNNIKWLNSQNIEWRNEPGEPYEISLEHAKGVAKLEGYTELRVTDAQMNTIERHEI